MQFFSKEDAKVAESRLPFKAAAMYALGALGFISLVFITQCGRDRYPFGNWDDPCRPCVCDQDHSLVACAIPAEVKVSGLVFVKQHFTSIKPGAFKGNDHLVGTLSFPPANAPPGNKGYHDGYEPSTSINELTAGAFDGLENLRGVLDLSSLNISTIEPGAFRATRMLERLALRNNHLGVLPSGVFRGLSNLKLLLLDDNRIENIAPGAFKDTRRLETVWAPGNAVNCTHIKQAELARGATCIDAASCKFVELELFGIGDGRCYDVYDKYECAWD
jgi:hypothetical protein